VPEGAADGAVSGDAAVDEAAADDEA